MKISFWTAALALFFASAARAQDTELPDELTQCVLQSCAIQVAQVTICVTTNDSCGACVSDGLPTDLEGFSAFQACAATTEGCDCPAINDLLICASTAVGDCVNNLVCDADGNLTPFFEEQALNGTDVAGNCRDDFLNVVGCFVCRSSENCGADGQGDTCFDGGDDLDDDIQTCDGILALQDSAVTCCPECEQEVESYLSCVSSGVCDDGNFYCNGNELDPFIKGLLLAPPDDDEENEDDDIPVECATQLIDFFECMECSGDCTPTEGRATCFDFDNDPPPTCGGIESQAQEFVSCCDGACETQIKAFQSCFEGARCFGVGSTGGDDGDDGGEGDDDSGNNDDGASLNYFASTSALLCVAGILASLM